MSTNGSTAVPDLGKVNPHTHMQTCNKPVGKTWIFTKRLFGAALSWLWGPRLINDKRAGLMFLSVGIRFSSLNIHTVVLSFTPKWLCVCNQLVHKLVAFFVLFLNQTKGD
jgi:hypothetical protein